MTIPAGWQFYHLSRIADVATAMAVGKPAPARSPMGVWLDPDVFAQVRWVAVRRDQWPHWTCCIAKLKRSRDVGVGDTFARMLGKFGKRFKTLAKRLGAPCRCTRRQAEWNRLYPYEGPPQTAQVGHLGSRMVVD